MEDLPIAIYCLRHGTDCVMRTDRLELPKSLVSGKAYAPVMGCGTSSGRAWFYYSEMLTGKGFLDGADFGECGSDGSA